MVTKEAFEEDKGSEDSASAGFSVHIHGSLITQELLRFQKPIKAVGITIPEFLVAGKFKFEFHPGFLFAGDVSVVVEGPALRSKGVPRGGRLRGERQRRGEEQRRPGQGATGNVGKAAILNLVQY